LFLQDYALSMIEEPPNSDVGIDDLSVRNIKGYYNLGSGRLEEILIEISSIVATDQSDNEERLDEISTNDVEFTEDFNKSWYKVTYEVSLGTARVDKIPEITNIRALANLLARTDLAAAMIDPVKKVEPWHKVYEQSYAESSTEAFENVSINKEDIPTPDTDTTEDN